MQVAVHLPPLFPPVSIVQVANFSVCKSSINKLTALIHFYASIPRFVLGVILLILAVIPALKESVDIYKVTKRWQSNQYMQRVMRDGIIYFLMYVFPFPSLSSFTCIPYHTCTHLTLEYPHKN